MSGNLTNSDLRNYLLKFDGGHVFQCILLKSEDIGHPPKMMCIMCTNFQLYKISKCLVVSIDYTSNHTIFMCRSWMQHYCMDLFPSFSRTGHYLFHGQLGGLPVHLKVCSLPHTSLHSSSILLLFMSSYKDIISPLISSSPEFGDMSW